MVLGSVCLLCLFLFGGGEGGERYAEDMRGPPISIADRKGRNNRSESITGEIYSG